MISEEVQRAQADIAYKHHVAMLLAIKWAIVALGIFAATTCTLSIFVPLLVEVSRQWRVGDEFKVPLTLALGAAIFALMLMSGAKPKEHAAS
jgi:di/tricarboxylate transporter